MRKRKKEITLMFLSGLCCLTLLAGCGSKENNPAEGEENEEVQSAGTDSFQEISDSGEQKGTENIGEFSTEDVQGNSYTQEMFGDYDLTMVNVFATWCGPCISEIPDLEKLYGEMKEQGVNVAGIVLDAADGSGNPDAEAVEKSETAGGENRGVLSVPGTGRGLFRRQTCGD